MPLDNFRRARYNQPKKPRPQAIDGILGGPINTQPDTKGKQPTFVHRTLGSGRATGRRVGEFKRADGYHPISQLPAKQPFAGAAPIQSDAVPSIIHKTLAGDRPLSQALERSHAASDRIKAKHRFGWRKGIVRTGISLALIVGISGGLLFAKGYFKLHQIFKGGSSAAALQANVDPNLLKGEGDGRINILLLGIGGDGHDGPDLTDTMIVASVDPVNHKAGLLSIPRDLWVKMPNSYVGKYQKINAAYEAGKYSFLGRNDDSNANHQAVAAGFKSVDQVVTQVLGISINYNVLVDFRAFQQAVDTVGGVTVDVPTEVYDPTIAWENHNNPVIAKAGAQSFNGQQALLYVRSRETSSDFARSLRQRAVLVALKQKVLTIGTYGNPLKVSQLASAFGDNVVSDLSITDGLKLYAIGKQINNSNIASIGLADQPNNFVTTDNLNGLSVVRPTAGFYNYTDIQNFVHSQLPDSYLVKENAQITILNGTTTPGLATQEAAILKPYGYNIGTVADAPTQTYARTVIVDLSKGVDKYTKHYLEQRFGLSVVSKLPDSTIQPGSAKFVIILGQNDATNSKT